MKVLIIDDSAVMRNMIKRALQAGGVDGIIGVAAGAGVEPRATVRGKGARRRPLVGPVGWDGPDLRRRWSSELM